MIFCAASLLCRAAYAAGTVKGPAGCSGKAQGEASAKATALATVRPAVGVAPPVAAPDLVGRSALGPICPICPAASCWHKAAEPYDLAAPAAGAVAPAFLPYMPF